MQILLLPFFILKTCGKNLLMNLEFYISRFGANAKVFEALVSGIDDEQARWKQAHEKWSILEILNHLYDEEKDDFCPRLEKTLRDPKEEWTKIAPADWVKERNYNERDLNESLQKFLQEREKSIEWLKTIENPKWENSRRLPQITLSAGDLLASWLAHDLLHIKQITRLHYDYINFISEPYKTLYAGNWT